MKIEDCLLATFRNAREVIRADRLARHIDLSVVVMPVPEHISSECGMCLRIHREEKEKFDHLMQINQIEVSYYE